eukprot:SM000078S22043  [mRNA]  locus=s78:134484:137012:- [translate_table: standard]
MVAVQAEVAPPALLTQRVAPMPSTVARLARPHSCSLASCRPTRSRSRATVKRQAECRQTRGWVPVTRQAAPCLRPERVVNKHGLTFRASSRSEMPSDAFNKVDCGPQKKMRGIVEHVVLLQMQDNLTDEQEAEMLDHLYTLQYYYRYILSTSLGRIHSRNSKGFTHALLVRFPSQKALTEYYELPHQQEILQRYVNPYLEVRISKCITYDVSANIAGPLGMLDMLSSSSNLLFQSPPVQRSTICVLQDVLIVDFESEVEEDIEALFRRGDAFEAGIEHIVLVRVKEGTSKEDSKAMVEALAELPSKIGDNVVQLTTGTNFAKQSQGYTHGLVVRVPSDEDLQAYNKHPSHREVLKKWVLPVSQSLLAVDFRVDPIGSRLM